MLSYGTDAKKSQLTSQLYFKDKTGHYDDNDVNNGVNTSMYTRSMGNV
jgi:protocatechuate 3,4-dioxygenase beta subunit